MANRSKNGTVYDWYEPKNGADDAPIIVLIHGLGLRRGTWDGHIRALSAQYRVLNYDLYGHGDSVRPPHKPDLTLYAEQLRALMDELGIEKAALMGFSLGGMINRRFAMNYPDRASSLVILNSPHERSEEGQKLVEQRAADTSTGGPEATLDATITRWFTANFITQHGDVIERIRQWVLANDHMVYAQCRQVLAHGVIELIRPDPPITHPTLVITCENDSGSTPEMSHAIASEIKDAQIQIIPNLQHMGLVQAPDLFTKPVLDFLCKNL